MALVGHNTPPLPHSPTTFLLPSRLNSTVGGTSFTFQHRCTEVPSVVIVVTCFVFLWSIGLCGRLCIFTRLETASEVCVRMLTFFFLFPVFHGSPEVCDSLSFVLLHTNTHIFLLLYSFFVCFEERLLPLLSSLLLLQRRAPCWRMHGGQRGRKTSVNS